MCRLGGVVLSNQTRSEEDYIRIAEELLGMLVRMDLALGGDGNSISFHYPNGDVRIIKDHREYHKMFSRFDQIKNNLKEGATIVQMHARLSTCGPSEQHENMHPFTHGPIIGAHNGQVEDRHIWNDLAQFEIEPYTTTDSEAIFASLSVYAPSLHPKQVQTTLNDLWGTYALSIVSKQRPNQLVLISQDNPLCYYHNRKDKELWYASTSDLFPDSLAIPTKKVSTKIKYGKNKGQITYKTEPRVTILKEGEGVYIRTSKRKVTTEHVTFDVNDPFAYPYPYNYDYRDAYGYGFNTYDEYADMYDYNLTKDEAIHLHKQGASIYLVHEDGTESYALDITEIEAHKGEFNYEF